VTTSRSARRQSDGPSSLAFEPSRPDLVLAAIPAAFLLAAVASAVFGLGARPALAGGSLLGALAVGDALFLNPPVTDTGTDRDAGSPADD
jgi:hypothetical protein